MPRSSNLGMRKIDNLATDGLAGVGDSLAYRVEEIEKHFHNEGICYGNNGANNLQLYSVTPFRITSGNPAGAWGTALQFHDGTIIRSGAADEYFDFHGIFVVDLQAAENYCLQVWYGTTDFAHSTLLTSTYYRRALTKGDLSRQIVVSHRITCNNKLWATCKSESASQWLDFLIEVHNYAG